MAKFCTNCGHPVEDGDVFCSECGARLDTAEEAPAGTTNKEPEPVKAEILPPETLPAGNNQPVPPRPSLSLDTGDMGGMAALVGAVMAAISVFLEAISIVMMGSISFMDISKLAGVFIILAALIGAFGILSRTRCVTVGAGTGLLITFLAIFLYYEHAISELKKGFFGAMASQAVSLGSGMYLLCLGAVLLIGGALYSSALRKSRVVSVAALLNEWKENLLGEFHVGSIPLHAWIITVAVPILVYVAVTQSNVLSGVFR